MTSSELGRDAISSSPSPRKKINKAQDLIERLQKDYPKLIFRPGPKFKFRPPKTVYYLAPRNDFAPEVIANSEENPSARGSLHTKYDSLSQELLLLHEVGHALLGHRDFKTAPERLRLEVEAWEKAKELAPKYEVPIDEDLIESELDSYRDWLHQKSKCPNCSLTRYQTPNGVWHCPYCDAFLR